MDPLRDPLEPVRPVVDRVQAGHDGEEHLGRADVARRLFPADVLLARGQGHAVGRPAVRVLRQSDQASGQLPDMVLPAGEKRGVRAAEPQRHAEPLRRSDGDVGAPLAGRFHERQREEIRGHHRHDLGLAGLREQVRRVVERAVGRRILEQEAEAGVAGEGPVFRPADAEDDAEGFGPRLHHGDGLGMAMSRNEKLVACPAAFVVCDAPAHGHGLGGSRGFVQERGIGDRQAGQVRDHRLKIHQGLQAALRDFRLVGRVGRVPAGIFQDVAENHRGSDAVVVAQPDKGASDAVAARQFPKVRQHVVLAARVPQGQRPLEPDVGRDDRVGQGVERGQAERRQHLLDVGIGGPEVPVKKRVGGLKEIVPAHGVMHSRIVRMVDGALPGLLCLYHKFSRRCIRSLLRFPRAFGGSCSLRNGPNFGIDRSHAHRLST